MATKSSRYKDTRVKVEPRVSWKFKLLVLFVISALGVIGATQTSVGEIKEINIAGAELTPVEVIRAVAQIRIGDPITNFLSSSVEGRLTEIGALSSVEVRRNWQDRVVDIRVVEKEVRLSSRSESGFWMIATDGTVLAEVDDVGLVELIEGPATEQVVGEPVTGYPASLIEVTGVLETSEIDVDQLIVSEDGTLSIEYDPLGTVVIGTPSGITEKIGAMRAIERSVDLRCIEEVDVSVAQLPTVRRNQGCAERVGLVEVTEPEVGPELAVEQLENPATSAAE